ncbi:hypothetical protein SAMN05216371_0221 [Streptomyces sp. TLI_053]|uniref:hypothetical protein n=1 Tax=Streptomyces sp. TLI_053 TaxID=1855352 RepID=UPI00087C68CB|nr:hypothetical protein [Streptomyces sp. TLI_053]SDS59095.1 hypothetical protein SAMN05216371_0221 [Streptomyces sp. TLI_053]
MTIAQRLAGEWKTVVAAGVLALAVTGGVAAPAGAATQVGSAAESRSSGNQDLAGAVQPGEPAHPRDHPGGRPLIKHHWVVRLQYAAVQALNQRSNYSWQRNYKDWTVAVVGNNIQGKEVTVYTKITNLFYGEGGVIGAGTAPTSQVAIAHNTIVAQGNVNIVTEIVNVHVISPKWEDVFSGQCRAQEDLRNAVKDQLACTLG